MNAEEVNILSDIIKIIDCDERDLLFQSVSKSLVNSNAAIKQCAFFLHDNEIHDFKLTKIYPDNDPGEIGSDYESLIEDGIIADLINSELPVSYSKTGVVIRLATKEYLYGFIFIKCFKEPPPDDNYAAVSKLLSLWFDNYHKRKGRDTHKKNIVEQNYDQNRALLEGIQNLRNILDSLQAGIVLVNPETQRIEDANSMTGKLTGLSKDDLIGMKREELFLLNSWDYKEFGKLLGSESILKRKDGNVIPVILTEEKIKLGTETFILSTFSDISEQKRLEDELLELKYQLEQKVEERTKELKTAYDKLKSEMEARSKLEKEKLKLYYAIYQSPVAMVIVDLEGKIDYVNPKFYNLTGFYYDDVIGKRIADVVITDNNATYIEEIIETISQEKVWHKDIRIKKNTGEFIWVSASVSGIVNDRGKVTHYLAVYEDISIKKKAEEEIIRSKEKAEEAARLKSSLLANMSHEFRTPLIGILGFTELLLEDDLNEETKEIVEDIHSAGKRLLNTLDSVLQLSELESLSGYLQLSESPLNGLIKIQYDYFYPIAAAKGLQIKLNLPEFDLHSEIDNNLFTRALGNIIDNAIKFTSKGEISISAYSIEKDGLEWNVISIADTGIGIDESDKEIIFKEFRQASEGHKRNYEGTGLGLTLSKKMIEYMKGYISLESQKGKGSVFYVYLPAVEN